MDHKINMENNDFDTFDVNYDAASDGYKFDCFSEITDYTLQGNGVSVHTFYQQSYL